MGCPEIEQSSSIITPNMISTFVGFLGGFLTAMFAEPLRQIIFRPNLKLEFYASEDCVTPTPETNPNGIHDAFYIRIKATNTKPRLAQKCRAYLVMVEKEDDKGDFCPTEYCDSIQLAWACKGTQAYAALDLPRGIAQFVDVVSTRSIAAKNFRPEIRPFPFRYASLFQQTGVFRFTIQVSGDGIKPKFIQIIFDWKGAWNTFKVKPV
jgi:hypothetical protein